MNQKFKTVLIDTTHLFEGKIEEVIEYYYENFIQWAIIKYYGDTRKYAVPLFALGIKCVPLFGVVND